MKKSDLSSEAQIFYDKIFKGEKGKLELLMKLIEH